MASHFVGFVMRWLKCTLKILDLQRFKDFLKIFLMQYFCLYLYVLFIHFTFLSLNTCTCTNRSLDELCINTGIQESLMVKTRFRL